MQNKIMTTEEKIKSVLKETYDTQTEFTTTISAITKLVADKYAGSREDVKCSSKNERMGKNRRIVGRSGANITIVLSLAKRLVTSFNSRYPKQYRIACPGYSHLQVWRANSDKEFAIWC